MAYVPVVVGEANSLRSGVESFFDGNDQTLATERLYELDERVYQLGLYATFGTEIELEFAIDPTSSRAPSTLSSRDRLYQKIIAEMQGSISADDYRPVKGEVLWPDSHEKPLLVNPLVRGTYNPDQEDSDIIEVRTAPIGAPEALQRYWQTLDAIGRVAAHNGLMAMVLSTHVNSAVTTHETDSEGFTSQTMINFGNTLGANILAGTQHNLNALQPLQFDAGLVGGIAVTEAFPTKDTSTAVHSNRLEFRHADIGVTDPRIDMLATLTAIEQAATHTLPAAALKNVRRCHELLICDIISHRTALEMAARVDLKNSQVVVPTQIDPSSRDHTYNLQLDNLVAEITEGEHAKATAEGGQILRTIAAGLRVNDDKLVVDNGNPYAQQLTAVFERTPVRLGSTLHRVLPNATFNSPEANIERRLHIKSSSTVRHVLGNAVAAISPAHVAHRRRQELIDAQVIICEQADDN